MRVLRESTLETPTEQSADPQDIVIPSLFPPVLDRDVPGQPGQSVWEQWQAGSTGRSFGERSPHRFGPKQAGVRSFWSAAPLDVDQRRAEAPRVLRDGFRFVG
jgi:hypothetical protein